MAKENKTDTQSKTTKPVPTSAFVGTGRGYIKRRMGLLSNELDTKGSPAEKEAENVESSE